jgi:hypothetical protein
MRIKIYAAIAALALAPAFSYAQDVNKLISQADVERIIKTLSADDMQGRATFSPGIDKAATFIEGEFKKAGIKPLAGAAGFRQTFSKTRFSTANVKVSLDGVEVPADKVSVSAGTAFNWKSDADVEVVTIGADKKLPTEYRAIVRGGKKTLAIVDPSFEDLFKRIQARNSSGVIADKASTAPAVVFVLGTAVPKAFDVFAEVKEEKLSLSNVAGMIPGKSKPNEYVIFSGHYDHLGIIKPMDGDSIANGADDDATGTTAVISLAKYYKKLNNNERTLIFVAFTAEEIGGYGSKYFSQQMNADQVVAMFNIEMIGKDSKFGPKTAFITGFERSDFGPILQKNLEGTEFKFHPDPYIKENLFYRSDNATLAALGVPAHSISTDQIDSDKLYHSVNDEFESLDVNNIIATIRAIALSSRSIVSGKDTPTRIPKVAL